MLYVLELPGVNAAKQKLLIIILKCSNTQNIDQQKQPRKKTARIEKQMHTYSKCIYMCGRCNAAFAILWHFSILNQFFSSLVHIQCELRYIF